MRLTARPNEPSSRTSIASVEGRTAFVVAHRLSTIRDADVICVIEQGRIVERGSHEELVRRQGLYAYLVAQQLDG